MVLSSRLKIIAGNWKMFKTNHEATQFIEQLAPSVAGSENHIYLGVPFTLIQSCVQGCQGTKIVIGAQNMHHAENGAFTGEISSAMLKDAGAQFVILGHSERRHIFGETNAFVNLKIKSALHAGIQPILCVGETKEEREQGKMEQVLETQLNESLADVSAEQISQLLIAYEPVWAIGTGLTATPEQAQNAHQFCRSMIEKSWGKETADRVPLLYGGSVKPDNARTLMEQPDLDGVLVGGASLSAESFAQIVNFQTIKV